MTPLPAAAGEPGVQRGPAAPHRGGAPGRSRPPAPPQAADFHHERLELAVEATELGLWEWDIRTGELFWSERQRAIFGVAPQAALSYQSWSDALHPEDRDWVIALVRDLLVPGSTGRLQMEHRVVRPSGEVRWVFANGRLLYEGAERAPARLLGTVFDITDRKRAEEDRQLLLRELNHRVKNLFAVTSGLVALTARSAATPQEMGTALRGRIEALARAHDLLQPGHRGRRPRRPADGPRAARPGDPRAVRRPTATRSPSRARRSPSGRRPRRPSRWCCTNAPPTRSSTARSAPPAAP